MTKNKILKICRPREGGDPCSQRHHATPKMDSRLRGKDNIIFVMYKVGLVEAVISSVQTLFFLLNIFSCVTSLILVIEFN